ncbi:hypothetical protein [Azospirillum argentinense]|uniref:hypothetical protein n=1 Tax=Azospirillum argentinense TaxID=2970906 RepID=UPI0032E034CA
MLALTLPSSCKLWTPFLWATACIPSGGERRQQFYEALLGEIIRDAPRCPLPGTPAFPTWLEMLPLAGRPEPEDVLLREAPTYIRDGNAAGFILGALAMKQWGKGRSVTEYAKLLKQKGTQRGVTSNTIEAAWSRYESVAHLWAAFKLWGSLPSEQQRSLIAAQADGPFLIGAAEWFRDKAATTVPTRARASFVDPSRMQAFPSGAAMIVDVRLGEGRQSRFVPVPVISD